MTGAVADAAVGTFVHEALLYAGDDEFAAGTAPFVRAGVDAGEPVMVAVPAAKIEVLRSVLGPVAAEVVFADMNAVGANPARMISAWEEFLADRAPDGRPVRGVGEPVNPARSSAALRECQHHEVLLNVAFAGRPDFWLLCPYDTTTLAPAVVDEAIRSHPFVARPGGSRGKSTVYGVEDPPRFTDPLPEPTGDVDSLTFSGGHLVTVRQFLTAAALLRGLDERRLPDLLLAANELATNSVVHGGGHGLLRVWQEPGTVVCEVRDAGTITEPLVGRRRPDGHRENGRGLWMVNQLCDLVELRSGPAGTVVRIHMLTG